MNEIWITVRKGSFTKTMVCRDLKDIKRKRIRWRDVVQIDILVDDQCIRITESGIEIPKRYEIQPTPISEILNEVKKRVEQMR